MGGQSKAIFWIGTLSSAALFLALTLDTHRQFGFGGYYAPDLTRAYVRIGADGIRRRLEHPEQAFLTSYRKMPQQRLSGAEIADITRFLRWVDGIENNDFPPQDSQRSWKRSTERLLAGALLTPGAALLKQENCIGCHALGDGGERVGPRLEWIGGKRDAAWIADLLLDPGRLQLAMEPLPILLMLVDTFRAEREGGRRLEPRLTWTFIIGMAVLHFAGAGLFGLIVLVGVALIVWDLLTMKPEAAPAD